MQTPLRPAGNLVNRTRRIFIQALRPLHFLITVCPTTVRQRPKTKMQRLLIPAGNPINRTRRISIQVLSLHTRIPICPTTVRHRLKTKMQTPLTPAGNLINRTRLISIQVLPLDFLITVCPSTVSTTPTPVAFTLRLRVLIGRLLEVPTRRPPTTRTSSRTSRTPTLPFVNPQRSL